MIFACVELGVPSERVLEFVGLQYFRLPTEIADCYANVPGVRAPRIESTTSK